MRILLDECLPVDLRHNFPDHEVHTSEWAGLKGKQNGESITVDSGVPRQRSRASRLSIILLRSKTNQLEDLLPLVGRTAEALMSIQAGQTIIVSGDA